MADVYMYDAALYCVPCGQDLPACPDSDCDDSHDSGDYRVGPYPDGAGESDSPAHCDTCSGFLENPLTSDGITYVAEELNAGGIPEEWSEFYRFEIAYFLEND